jgi:hypothetical protein
MPSPSSQVDDAPRTTRGINTSCLLRRILAVTIVVSSVAPIILHRHPAFLPSADRARHPVLRGPTPPSRRGGKTPSVWNGSGRKRQLDGAGISSSSYEDDGRSVNVSLPPDIGRVGRSLLLRALDKRPVWDEDVRSEVEAERCGRYFSYYNRTKFFARYDAAGGRRRRRVFLGSLIADDSWHALAALAIETYGVYAAVAFVESNRTQTGSPRRLRFADGTAERGILAGSGLFGPDTPVMIENFVHEGAIEGRGLIREQMQRSLIIGMWKKAGMTRNDIGVLTDADETPSRDFLRAMQICDVPELDPETQNCHTAKLISASMVFEGSPECMTVTRKWMHPDLILGKCIEGIGDDEFKLDDSQRQRKSAWRKKEYTHKYGNYSGWPKEKKSK